MTTRITYKGRNMREEDKSPKILIGNELIIKLETLLLKYKDKLSSNRWIVVCTVGELIDNKIPTTSVSDVMLQAWCNAFAMMIDSATLPLVPLKAVGYWFFGHTKRARIQPIEKIITILTETKTLEKKEGLDWQNACLEYRKQRNLIANTPSTKNQLNGEYSSLMNILAETDDYFSYRPWLVQQMTQFISCFPPPIVYIFIDFLYGEQIKIKILKEESIQPVPEEGVGCEVGAEFELKKEKKELKPSLASSSFLTQEPKKKLPSTEPGLLEKLGFNKQKFLADFKQIEVDFKSLDSHYGFHKDALIAIYKEIKKVFWETNQLAHTSEILIDELHTLKAKIKETQGLLFGEVLSNPIVSRWYDNLGEISKGIDALMRVVIAQSPPSYS